MHALPYNMDRKQRLCIETESMPWRESPMPGVVRKALEREKAESGQVTSVVRYDAGSRFSAHTHPNGEEIFVLEGTFLDELGNYPKGTWIRSPHLSTHNPFSTEGCTILVKVGHL